MPSLYTRFVSHGLFPLQERLKRHDTVRVHRDLDASQWWPPARIAELQARRLRALLADTGRHVPYYRDLFAQRGYTLSRLRAWDLFPNTHHVEAVGTLTRD